MHKRFNFIFCDDIRRELGNKISLMGVYSPVAQMHATGRHSITVVCMLQVEPDSDLSDSHVQIGISIDGASQERHDLANLPAKAPSQESRSSAFAALKRAAPDSHPELLLLGTMRFEALSYMRTCELVGYVNDVEQARVLLFRDPAVKNMDKSDSSSTAKQKRPKKAAKKNIAVTKKKIKGRS